MEIKIGPKTKEYMQIIGINSYPFTVSELTKVKRSLMKKYHPDVCKNQEVKTSEINSALDHLSNLAIEDITDEHASIIRGIYEDEKEDLFTFWENCQECSGTGNKVVKAQKGKHYEYKVYKCHKCFGVGKIKNTPFNPVIDKGAILNY